MKKIFAALFVTASLVTIFLIAKNNNQIPKGWRFNAISTSEYDVGIDHTTFKSGKSSTYIKSNNSEEKEFGNLMQAIDAKNYLGKRLQLTGYIKSDNVNGSCQLWMRVDGENPMKSLSFDNMMNRPITGTTDWKQYSIVLDVPDSSKTIYYGVLISGTGKVWIDNFTIKEVDKSVPVTDMFKPSTLPYAPVNLDFEE